MRFTLPEARLREARSRVFSVIGMCRAGKTPFLLQLLEARPAQMSAERANPLSFDDGRLAETQK